MRISVDTEQDSLEKVAAVLGAAYGTTISTANGAREEIAAPAERAPRAGRARSRARTAAGRGRAGAGRATAARARRRPAARGARGSEGLDLAAVRSWAIENGRSVSSRGRIPNAVVEAYREAHA